MKHALQGPWQRGTPGIMKSSARAQSDFADIVAVQRDAARALPAPEPAPRLLTGPKDSAEVGFCGMFFGRCGAAHGGGSACTARQTPCLLHSPSQSQCNRWLAGLRLELQQQHAQAGSARPAVCHAAASCDAGHSPARQHWKRCHRPEGAHAEPFFLKWPCKPGVTRVAKQVQVQPSSAGGRASAQAGHQSSHADGERPQAAVTQQARRGRH